jgi:hypothetical protein
MSVQEYLRRLGFVAGELQFKECIVLTCHFIELVQLGFRIELCLFPAVRPVMV